MTWIKIFLAHIILRGPSVFGDLDWIKLSQTFLVLVIYTDDFKKGLVLVGGLDVPN